MATLSYFQTYVERTSFPQELAPGLWFPLLR